MAAQFQVLLAKNYRLRRRSPHATLCEFLYPIIVAGLLLGFFWMIAGVSDQDRDRATYDVEQIPALKDLDTLNDGDDYNLLMFPEGHADVEKVQGYIKARLPGSTSIKTFKSEADLVTYYHEQYTSTWCGLVFYLTPEQQSSGKLFPAGTNPFVNFTLRYSQQSDNPSTYGTVTSFKPSKKSPSEGYISSGFLSLMQTVDEVLAEISTGQVNVTTAYTQRFRTSVAPPKLTNGVAAVRYNTFRNVVGVFLMVSLLFSFYRLQTDLVIEKTTRIREAMKMMGMKPSAYYATWFCTTMLMLAVPTLLVIVIVKYGQVFPEVGIFAAWVMTLVFIASLINLSFLLSVFVNNPKFAGPIGAIVFLACSAGGIFAATDKLSGQSKTALMLFSPLTFGLANRVIMEQEAFGTGLSFGTMSDEHIDITFTTCLVMLFVDTILYGLLAWYCDAVFPGEYGLSHGYLFLFKPSYWTGQADLPATSEPVPDLENAEGANARPHSNSDVEEPPHGAECSIRIRQLRKEYTNGTVAVRNLNLDIHQGQILAFLGHNGAGKSTTISMLTGLIPCTAGDAVVLGSSITTNMDTVRKTLGVCPQHDVIWEKLSVREHLSLYAGLKGVPASRIADEVQDMIVQLNLMPKADAAAGTLSGGQKRKLCVGIALIGGSKIVFLDEPTSGMDPVARRDVWKVLKKNKTGRTIIFTTHFMDEADLLGDRIAILSQGKLRCAGSSLFLKTRFGTGYAIILSKTPECREKKVTKFIKQYITNSELVSDVSAELAYRLPRESVSNFPDFFANLEDRKDSLGIRHFGVSLTTLEDVFLRVGMDGEDQEAARLLGAPDVERKSRTRALSSETQASEHMEGNPVNVSSTGRNVFQQMYALIFIKRMRLAFRDVRFLVFQTLFPVLCVLGGLLVLKALAKKPENAPALSFNWTDAVGSNATAVWGGVAGASSLIKDLPGYSSASFVESQGPSIDAFLESDLKLAERASGAFNVTSTSTLDTDFISLFNPKFSHAIPLYTHLMNEAAVRQAPNFQDYTVSLSNAPFPPGPLETAILNINGAMILGFFLLLGFSVSSAGVAAFIVREREEQRKYLQLANGASKPVYWLSTLIADYLSYLVSAIGAIILFAAFSYGSEVGGGGAVGAAVMLLLYGPAAILASYLLSFAFTVYSVAQGGITAMLFFFGFFAISPIVSVGIINGPTSLVVRILTIVLSAISPTFGLMLSILKINDFVGLRTGAGKGVSLWSPAMLGDHVIIFLAQFGAYLILLFLIDMKKEIGGLFGTNSVTAGVDLDPEEEDDDVITEAQRVARGCRDSIVVDSIRQEFPAKWENHGTKVAVRHISLGIGEGECFGLLGHNGAGKTTLLKILSCSDLPTNGTARINSHSIHSAAGPAQTSIGLCPQFDLLMGKLTGREHLQLYARLKGLPSSKINDTVQSFIDLMDLSKYADKYTQGYSGGNKRKLSLAIALIGNPPVVLLDEPSTGMDPVARRFMWNLISKVSAGRAMILTTHSMEECDNLCTRIGIMKAGGLVCLGSSQHLKGKFGTGYSLEVKANTIDNAQRTAALLDGAIKATLVESHGTMLNYQVSSENVTLSSLFKLLEDSKQDYGIVDYSVGQPTLEQIFLKLAKQEDEEEPAHSGAQYTWGELFKAYFWLLLSILLPGIHHFWMHRWLQGFAYFLTWNVIGLGWLYDLVFMASYVDEAHRKNGALGFCCCHPGRKRPHKNRPSKREGYGSMADSPPPSQHDSQMEVYHSGPSV